MISSPATAAPRGAVAPAVAYVTPLAPGEAGAPQVSEVTVPAVAGCVGEESTQDDARCPEEVVLAAAMSWLGKTTAVYDGVHLELVEHDPAQVRAEAEQDAGFRRLLAEADAAPCDGRLDGSEARDLEDRVLAAIEARYAAG